jgi:hypothetical protein
MIVARMATTRSGNDGQAVGSLLTSSPSILIDCLILLACPACFGSTPTSRLQLGSVPMIFLALLEVDHQSLSILLTPGEGSHPK